MATIKAIYDFFIQEGIRVDFRNKKEISKSLLEKRKEFRQLKAPFRKFFDKECLENPYTDTRILYGNPDKEINRILVGIDMEVGELLLAHQLSLEGREVDLVLAHHPEGIALASLDEVMHLQTDGLRHQGMAEKVAKDLMGKRIEEVARRLHSANHSRTVDAARLLDIPLMCCHTPADNHVNRFLQRLMDTRKPKALQEMVDLLMKEPEYQLAYRYKVGPKILVGKPKDKAGKVFVDMTGGTEGSKEIFGRLSQMGIKTYLCMHIAEDHFNKVKDEYLNVVNAGHIASDNLGMNLLLDKLERKFKVEIVECSGFRRFRRSWA